MESYSSSFLKDTLIYILPISLSINFSLVLVGLGLNWKIFKKYFKEISSKIWFILLLIVIISFALRTFVAPIGHRIYYDEDIYLNIGQNILQEGKAILCNYGADGKCLEWIMNKQPQGFPFLLSFVFLLFGVKENVGFYTSIILGSLSSVLIFLLSYLLTKKKIISLFSALIFALLPVHIRWSTSVAVEPSTVFFTLLAVLSLFLYIKEKNFKISLLAFSSLAFAVQFRPEMFLLFPVALLAILLYDKKNFERFEDKRFLIPVVIFFILIFPHLLQVGVFKESSWGASGEKFSLEHFQGNFPTNSSFYFNNQRFPALFSVFALIGIGYSLKNNKRDALFLGVWFLLFFLIYCFFYAGSYNYGVDVRFSLNTYPPWILLSGYGFYWVSKLLHRFLKRKISNLNFKVIAFVSGLVILTQILFFSGFISEFGRKGWDARVAHDFAVKEVRKFDENCYVFSHVPSMFLVNNVNALQTWNTQNKERVNDIFSKTDCVLFFKGYWCHAEPYKSGICKYVRENYNLTTISSKKAGHKEFVLYEVEEK